MPNELKPCPFCGGEASEETMYSDNIPMFFVMGCFNDNCLIHPSTPTYTDIENARNAWNERAYKATNPGYIVQVKMNENVLVRAKSMEDYEKFIKSICDYARTKFSAHLKRYIDPGQLRSPTERWFSETDVIRIIDRAEAAYRRGKR